jgi:nucleoside-diphosphate-sugar epimerase
MPTTEPRSVLVTGACGNLGRKIIAALASTPWCTEITGLDLRTDPALYADPVRPKLRLVAGDLSRPGQSWGDSFAGIDAVVHLAAERPDVDATWQQASNSFDQTVNVGTLALKHGVGRLVFASSNHVMGGYKDAPLSDGLTPGALTTALAPAPGTRWHDGTRLQDATA